jgi:hypothetical protein
VPTNNREKHEQFIQPTVSHIQKVMSGIKPEELKIEKALINFRDEVTSQISVIINEKI